MRRWTNACFAALFSLFAALPAHAYDLNVLRLVANEWEPYTGARLINKGFASDIVGTALRRAGYNIEIQFVPWSRALNGVEGGQYDGIIGAWHNEERASFMLFSEPYITNDIVLFKRVNEEMAFNQLPDLKGKKIGIIRDYSYGEPLDSDIELDKVIAIDMRTNLVRLVNSKVDLIPADRYVMAHTLKSNYPEYRRKVELLDKPLVQRTLHLTISRKTPEFEKIIADFNTQLKLMEEEGLLQVMIFKHNLSF